MAISILSADSQWKEALLRDRVVEALDDSLRSRGLLTREDVAACVAANLPTRRQNTAAHAAAQAGTNLR